MTETEKEVYISKSLLKLNRHWTDGLIKKFLGEPDKLEVNPCFKSAAPMCLYSMKKVKRIERRKTFKEAKAKSENLQRAALERAEKKRKEAIEFAKNVRIDIPQLKKGKTVGAAISQYNRHAKFFKNTDDYVSRDSNWGILRRITINYIRHNKTLYEYWLRKTFGKVGVHEAHDILKERINEKIIERNPWLK